MKFFHEVWDAHEHPRFPAADVGRDPHNRRRGGEFAPLNHDVIKGSIDAIPQHEVLIIMPCSQTKLPTHGDAVPMTDLYDGPLWRHVKGNYPNELIAVISAEHGVLPPKTMLKTYDRKMTEDRLMQIINDRKQLETLKAMIDRSERVVILGGSLYKMVALALLGHYPDLIPKVHFGIGSFLQQRKAFNQLMHFVSEKRRSLEDRARRFATQAHATQQRKYTGEPYIVHPQGVVDILNTVPHSKEMIAAAWLHDVVEDTGTPLSEIEKQFGKKVAKLVGWLTDVSKKEDGNREFRKAMDRDHLAKAPGDAQTVKVADILHNHTSIKKHDPMFYKVWSREKLEQLDVMTRANPKLLALARLKLTSQ